MAVRSVFQVGKKDAIRSVAKMEITWNGGFARSQSRKNIAALHDSYHRMYPDRQLLEISSKSESELGRSLSAFNLMLKAPSGTENSVECFYQAGKVFEHGGPYTDLLDGPSISAKKDERLKTSGAVIGFELEGVSYPTRPASLFYEWLYIHALEQHPELADALMEYDGFTDIAFNPERGRACQAQACAVYVTLRRLGLLRHAMESAEAYASIAFSQKQKMIALSAAGAPPRKTGADRESECQLADGCGLIHPVFGEGTVIRTAGGIAAVNFCGTEKKLGCSWILQNCRVFER